LVRRLGRHALVDIRRTDAAYELAAGCVAGHDRVLAGRLWELGDGELAHVEPQVRFARRGIRAVALEAALREDRADVPVVVDCVGGKGAELGVLRGTTAENT